jgi:hypothetical protein
MALTTTHDVGRLFWHVIRVRKGTPFHHRALTQEYEEPFRFSDSHIFRLPFGRALVLGRWHTDEDIDEVEALRRATHVHGLDGRVDPEYDVATDDDGFLLLRAF